MLDELGVPASCPVLLSKEAQPGRLATVKLRLLPLGPAAFGVNA
jgi:hypothetical protein